MNVHNEVIKTIVNESFPDTKNFSLVGSYRRNKDESGDIDLIIDAKTNFFEMTIFGKHPFDLSC